MKIVHWSTYVKMFILIGNKYKKNLKHQNDPFNDHTFLPGYLNPNREISSGCPRVHSALQVELFA